jgi:hypothetical protein
MMDFLRGSRSDNTFGEQGFWGPYSEDSAGVLMRDIGLVFDTSIKGAWVTAEIAPQEMQPKRYAILKIKSNNPEGVEGFLLTFGGSKKSWHEWIGYRGKFLPALTKNYQTVIIDLFESGVYETVCSSGGADFALNKGFASYGLIIIESIDFVDEVL